MATWDDVRAYFMAEYRLLDDVGWNVRLKFRIGERKQPVFVTRYGAGGGEEWAVIESPIGALGEFDPVKALELVGDVTVGGLALSMYSEGERVVVLRHAVPLSNLDTNELDVPLRLLTRAADRLEEELTGRDDR